MIVQIISYSGAKVFPFGYHYKFTTEQIKNEIIIPVRNGQGNKGLLRICFPLGEIYYQ